MHMAAPHAAVWRATLLLFWDADILHTATVKQLEVTLEISPERTTAGHLAEWLELIAATLYTTSMMRCVFSYAIKDFWGRIVIICIVVC